ncbi:NAD(P)/FAD-dependent oxidoreductase [Lutimonas zeaxanthinifaciens]|uniref:NAD(P)/FAD-dependent oxidoreductase n=1 Tax=Lutimonas zeaxanthinifaciens TaxID=3060215 RepID=UPI00265CF008|nr:FAD-binding oxidoreductase [Lutimonas sp. YSD2104]WKK65267.1 FAD-binding oxidoreductase [Lutimonas sp. YSD2104]
MENQIDYIIVGLGLAGLAFAEELVSQGKSFVVFEDNSQTSSQVAGGMYNPVILKRFTPVWNAQEQLAAAIPFYKFLEQKLSGLFDEPWPIYRTFKSIEEQNNWFIASDKPILQDYMEPELAEVEVDHIHAPFKAGRLKHTGRIRVKELLNAYRDQLRSENWLREEPFRYERIITWKDHIEYGELKTRKIVFCEGNGIKKNPFFKNLPLKGTKGELITIHAPDLNLKYVLKSAVFIMPLGGDRYKVGATFNWKDKTNAPTTEGRAELEKKLKTVINCDYTVVGHEAGVRPTTGDRRPLLGVHPENNRLAVLNGLGTRGVMIAPLMAKKLYQLIENGRSLEKEIDISRFKSKP